MPDQHTQDHGVDAAAQNPPPLSPSSLSLTESSRNLGERVIEWGIFGVAGLSILFIFLIFFFVFREASPIIFGESRSEKKEFVADDYMLPGEVDPVPIKTDSLPDSMDTSGVAGVAKDTTPVAPPAPKSDPLADSIAATGYPVLTHESPVKLSHVFYDIWQPNSEHPRYGIYPILLGTLKTTIVALLIAIPLSIFAALYTAFFAPKKLRETIKPIIELLAGFPSVVIGFFCLVTVATLVQDTFGTEYRLNAIVGGIGLSLAVIPIIFTLTDDALRAIPGSLREAALALGASEWQTAYQVMLPAATPGIFAAILLGLGRAFGETMIILLACGSGLEMNWKFDIGVRTFASTIGSEMGEVSNGSQHYQILFLLGIILFIFSVIINLITEFYVKQRLIKRFRGAE